MDKSYVFYKAFDESILDAENRFGTDTCNKVVELYYKNHTIENIAKMLSLTEDQVALIIMSHFAAYEEYAAGKVVEMYDELAEEIEDFLKGDKCLNDLKKKLKECDRQVDVLGL
ncbi:TPA: hypothetical protein ACNABL_004794 [Escherichia coli]